METLTTEQLAQKLGVTAQTVRNRAAAGVWPATNIAAPGKRPTYRFTPEQVNQITSPSGDAA